MGDAYDDAEDAHWASGDWLPEEARGLFKVIMDHNAREAEWNRERLEEMNEAARLQAIENRGRVVKQRFNDLFYVLFREELLMEYSEEETPYGTRKVLNIIWMEGDLDGIIYPENVNYRA